MMSVEYLPLVFDAMKSDSEVAVAVAVGVTRAAGVNTGNVNGVLVPLVGVGGAGCVAPF